MEAGNHPANKNVELRLIPAEGGESKTIVSLFGGQETTNVNSWSPDNRTLAFVSYRIKGKSPSAARQSPPLPNYQLPIMAISIDGGLQIETLTHHLSILQFAFISLNIIIVTFSNVKARN